MIKAKFKTRFNADLDGKLAYAKYGEEENPPYQPVLILGPGNIQQPKQMNHQKWANVYNQLMPDQIIVYWYSDGTVSIAYRNDMKLHQPGLEEKHANLPLRTQLKKEGECTRAEEFLKQQYRQFMKDIKKHENYRKKKVDFFVEDPENSHYTSAPYYYTY